VALPGPKPKSPRLKIVEGNPGKRPIPTNTAATALPPTAPPEPDWADLFPAPRVKSSRNTRHVKLRNDARRAWREVVPQLDSVGVLARIDAVVLTEYAVCVARIRELERLLTRDGMTVETERGWVKHPAATIVGQYRGQLRFYVAELGLAPSSRGRLTVPGGPEDDPEDLLD
jgi:P27 family predicted phage terminase small subunit